MTKRTKQQDADLVEAWARGEPVEFEINRPPTSVLSIRIPDELLVALTEQARARNVSTSRLAREIIERSLERDQPTTPDQLARMFKRWVDEALPRPARKRKA